MVRILVWLALIFSSTITCAMNQGSSSSSMSASVPAHLADPKSRVQDVLTKGQALLNRRVLDSDELQHFLGTLTKQNDLLRSFHREHQARSETTEEQQAIVAMRNRLRVKWAKQVLELSLGDDSDEDNDDNSVSNQGGAIPDKQEIIDCIGYLELTIAEALVPINSAYRSALNRAKMFKTAHENALKRRSLSDYVFTKIEEAAGENAAKQKAVLDVLNAKKYDHAEAVESSIVPLADTLNAEEALWKDLNEQAKMEASNLSKEISELALHRPLEDDGELRGHAGSSATFDVNAVQKEKEREMTKTRLKDLIALLTQFKDTFKSSIDSARLDDDDDENDQRANEAQKKTIDEDFQMLIAYIKRRLLLPFTPHVSRDTMSIDTVEEEYGALLAELQDDAKAVSREIAKYRKTQEEIALNRIRASKIRLIEHEMFTDAQEGYSAKHGDLVFLAARLKLLVIDEVKVTESGKKKAVELTESEKKKLEDRKGELTAKEIAVIKKMQSGTCTIV